MEPIRILYVNGGIMNRGGIESYMMSYYRNIDRKKLQVDFIVHGFERGAYDDEIESMGGKIFRVTVKSKNYLGNIRQLKKIFNSYNYKIVHSHMDAMSTVVLKVAKECGIPIRIAHSHNTQHLTNNRIKYLLNEYARKNITKYATHYFACSEPAGRWLFGDMYVDNKHVTYVKNAIPAEQYKFSDFLRRKIRTKLKIEEELVVGHVGRFDYQKNHIYLLEVFSRLFEIEPKSKLVLVGDGHLNDKIKQRIEELNIADNVMLLGSRKDVNELLNAFDVFVLPSLFEGLGIVLIEAQANGLKCIASNTTPREVNISGNVDFLATNKSEIDDWVRLILNNTIVDREINRDIFILSGYEIKNEAKKLEELYFEYLGDLE